VLRLRALRASGDFDDYWMFHLAKEYERTHTSRYADGEVPNPLPATRARPNLKLVYVIGIAPVEQRPERAAPIKHGAIHPISVVFRDQTRCDCDASERSTVQ